MVDYCLSQINRPQLDFEDHLMLICELIVHVHGRVFQQSTDWHEEEAKVLHVFEHNHVFALKLSRFSIFARCKAEKKNLLYCILRTS